jgi:hypothetical protein
MSCWVVPTIAADYWQVSLDYVLQGMRDGSIASKTEQGFTFVDVMPEPDLSKRKVTPRTYVEALEVQESDFDELVSEEEEQICFAEVRGNVTRLRRAPVTS